MTAFMIASIALFALLSMALSTTSGASWSKRMMVVVYRVENHLRSLMSKRMVTGWSVDADGVSHCHDLMVLDPDRDSVYSRLQGDSDAAWRDWFRLSVDCRAHCCSRR